MNPALQANNQAMIAWAQSHIPGYFARRDAKAIALRDGGAGFTAVTIFDNFSTNDCHISVASDGSRRWLTRSFINASFFYPFQTCGFARLTALVSVENLPARIASRRLGFVIEGRLRRAGHTGEDLIVFGMLREECRWL